MPEIHCLWVSDVVHTWNHSSNSAARVKKTHQFSFPGDKGSKFR